MNYLQIVQVFSRIPRWSVFGRRQQTAVISSSKSVTIPAEVLLDLKADAGDRVEFIRIASGRYEFLAASINVTELKAMFGQKSESVSIHDMNKAIMVRASLSL